jgi:hypothetical protein
MLLLLFAVFLAVGRMNFDAHASEPVPGWKLERNTDKLTAKTTCRVIKENGPIFLRIGQMDGSKDIVWVEIGADDSAHITRFRIGSEVFRAGPVRTVLLQKSYLPTKPTIEDLLNAKKLSVEYEDRKSSELSVIEIDVDHIAEAIGRLHRMDCP